MAPTELIRRLNLIPLPKEGGFFVETFRSPHFIPAEALGHMYNEKRSFCTAIYYLLTPDTFSALHKLPGDEIFHFYCGDTVEMLQLKTDGAGEVVRIGSNIAAGERPQVIVPTGVWQGSRLSPGGTFALMGTTMSPGFEFSDCVHGVRDELKKQFPEYSALIDGLTHS